MQDMAASFQQKFQELRPAIETTYKTLFPVFFWANYYGEWVNTLKQIGAKVWNTWDPMDVTPGAGATPVLNAAK